MTYAAKCLNFLPGFGGGDSTLTHALDVSATADDIKKWASAYTMGPIPNDPAVLPVGKTLEETYAYWQAKLTAGLSNGAILKCYLPSIRRIKKGQIPGSRNNAMKASRNVRCTGDSLANIDLPEAWSLIEGGDSDDDEEEDNKYILLMKYLVRASATNPTLKASPTFDRMVDMVLRELTPAAVLGYACVAAVGMLVKGDDILIKGKEGTFDQLFAVMSSGQKDGMDRLKVDKLRAACVVDVQKSVLAINLLSACREKRGAERQTAWDKSLDELKRALTDASKGVQRTAMAALTDSAATNSGKKRGVPLSVRESIGLDTTKRFRADSTGGPAVEVTLVSVLHPETAAALAALSP
jgi:hypothetical protein